eukprot:scaffold135484_cov20-Prasinocladus_malaysianus.AAC.1
MTRTACHAVVSLHSVDNYRFQYLVKPQAVLSAMFEKKTGQCRQTMGASAAPRAHKLSVTTSSMIYLVFSINHYLSE